MHDTSKVLLGTTKSSSKVAVCYESDPANTPAGVAVSLKADASLSTALADGKRVGVSLGKDLSNNEWTSVCAKGLKVPLRCMDDFAYGIVAITSYANLIDDIDDTIEVAGVVFTAQTGSVSHGAATFRANGSNGATAISLADQINNHATASLLVTATAENSNVHIRANEAGDDGEEITLVYTDIDGTGTSIGATVTGAGTLLGGGSDFTISKGSPVYVDDVTGYATESTSETATLTNAIYAEAGSFTGIDENGAECTCVYIDMLGGL